MSSVVDVYIYIYLVTLQGSGCAMHALANQARD